MKKTWIYFFIVCLVWPMVGLAQDDEPYTVSTFECIGIYYPSEDEGECQVHYREAGEESWKAHLGLWFDARDDEYRGSLVGLKPDTQYEIKLTWDEKERILEAKTRDENYPIGKETRLENGVMRETLEITESGSPEGYHLVTVPEEGKSTIDVLNAEDHCIRIEADYVIVRGLELKNAARHALYIDKECQNIVIEDCRITFWGRIGGPKSYGNEGNFDSAIYANQGAGNLTIQRNLIEDPRGGSNDWDTGHPAGPQGISLMNTSGGNVIRYNEIRSSEDHGFNDAIGGGSNFSFKGSPNRDSDIYGNIITHVWDDAIESEGANMNVRIWGNYMEKTFQHIAVACTSKGPLYIFRNVFGESRRTHENSLGGSMIKVGERDEYGGGRRYVFHNTGLQPDGAFHAFSGHVNPNTITRNNIFDCPGRLTSSRSVDISSDFDYDLFTGMDKGIAREPHGVRGKPAYIHSYGLEFFPASTTTKIQWGKVPYEIGDREVTLTDPVVTVPNPVIDHGVPLPGFNDDYQGEGPDLGAFELGNPPLRFGRRAQGAQKYAPWEIR